MNKPFSLGSLLGIAVVTGAFVGCSGRETRAVEVGVQVYPNSANFKTSVVREITTPSGRQCVIVQGKNESSITCDWGRK